MADPMLLKQTLESKFPYLAEKVVAPRERRLFAEAPADKFREVFEYAVKELGFIHLCTITGMDDKEASPRGGAQSAPVEAAPKETLAALYHLAHPDGTLLNLKNRVPRESPVIQSVADLFPGAANYERELVDLLGFTVQGIPPGNRYPMPDDWPTDQHPLRKDWQPVK
jgi:membrane-bound hydrogenase subunit beta